MSITHGGKGITVSKSWTYVDGEQITVNTLEIDPMYAQVLDMISNGAPSGSILVVGDNGYPRWVSPNELFDSNLRQEYPALQQAWETIIEATENYYMVRKLVQDHLAK